MSNPFRDPAVRIELGSRVQRALMTRKDWGELVERFLDSELGVAIDDVIGETESSSS